MAFRNSPSVETAGGIEKGAEEPAMEKQAEKLKAAGIEASYSFGYGIPFVEINRLIANEDYKLLILGSHGKSISKKILLGSVSDSIIRNLTQRKKKGSDRDFRSCLL